jgi:hypothetical protein
MMFSMLARNGRLRSQWSVTFPESGGGKAELTGIIKVQVKNNSKEMDPEI